MTVTVEALVVAVDVHPPNAVLSEATGFCGTEKLVLKVTRIVLPAASAPLPLLVLKPIVQSAVALPIDDELLKVTALTPEAAIAVGPVKMPMPTSRARTPASRKRLRLIIMSVRSLLAGQWSVGCCPR